MLLELRIQSSALVYQATVLQPVEHFTKRILQGFASVQQATVADQPIETCEQIPINRDRDPCRFHRRTSWYELNHTSSA
jgi:hypothetical protein